MAAATAVKMVVGATCERSRLCDTHISLEVVFGEDLLDALGRRPDERRGVEVVDLVEVEEGGQVGEHLVADLVARLVALLDLVDDVVRHLVVLPHAEDVVALDGGAVPHQEDAALPLRHQQVRRVLPRHGAEVPAEMKRRSENGHEQMSH